ncbi:hypothetical protein KEJ18_02280 [Candidatus Bathyarchaeota archaeon]|nr:hypothetical protein [Candidatus Bathyarchaeota archaeon]
MTMRRSSWLRNRFAFSEIVSTVILTSVMVVIIVTASYFANDTLNFNVESVQFDQSVNAVLSLERIAKKMMFKPYSTGTVKTSFVTTDPYVVEEGTMNVIIVNATGSFTIASISASSFKIKGGDRVGVSTTYYYVGNDSLILKGLKGSLSCVKKYQDQGAWVSLDYNRIRCVYCGEMNYYNGTSQEPSTRNLIEITVVRLSSGEISPFETSRIILENTGVETQQILQGIGDFNIKVEFLGKEQHKSLTYLDGNATLPTLINLTIVDFEVAVLGGG